MATIGIRAQGFSGYGKPVSFDATKMIKDLDLLTQIQLPFLGAVTVNRLAKIAQKDVQAHMDSSFVYYSKFTQNSIKIHHYAKKEAPWTEVEVLSFAGKGNAPAFYLRPLITGGQMYVTRAQRRIRARHGIPWLNPIPDAPGAKTKSDLHGQRRIIPSQYVEALYGAKAMEDVQPDFRNEKKRQMAEVGKYIYVPYAGIDVGLQKELRKLGRGRLPTPGIYRISSPARTQLKGMSDRDSKIFEVLKSVPTVPAKFKFKETVQRSVFSNTNQVFNEVRQQFAYRPKP